MYTKDDMIFSRRKTFMVKSLPAGFNKEDEVIKRKISNKKVTSFVNPKAKRKMHQ
jgi:hypothetical protein